MKLKFILIILLAALLRFHGILSQDYWTDEVVTRRYSEAGWQQLVNFSIHDTHPPVFNMALKLWIFLTGSTLFSLRSFSVIFGIGAVVLLYWYGKRYAGKKAEVAAVLLSISPLHIWYSQNIRPYSFLPFFVLATCFLMFEYYRNQTVKKGAFLFLSAAVCSYTHYFGFIFCTVCLFLLTLSASNKKRAAGIFLIHCFTFLPWGYIIFTRQFDVLAVGSTENFTKFYPQNILGKFILGYTADDFSALLKIIIIVVFFYGAWCGASRKEYQIVFAGICSLFIASFFISWQIKDLYGQRFFCSVLPVFFLLFARGIQRIPYGNVLLIIGLFSLISSTILQKDDPYIHREISDSCRWILENNLQEDAIVVSDDINGEIVDYYLKNFKGRKIFFRYHDTKEQVYESLESVKGTVVFFIHPKGMLPFDSAEPFVREYLEKKCKTYKIVNIFGGMQKHERAPSAYEILLVKMP